MTQEQAEPNVEQAVTQALEELETVSVEAGEASAESAEVKAESEEEGKEKKEGKKEETFEDKVTRLAQSMKDKELKPVYKENTDLKAKISDLENQLNDKVWDRHLQSLFNDDVDNLGEDDAKIKQSDRQKVAGQVKEFRLKQVQVEKAEAELKDKLPKLGVIERDQKARNDLWTLLFPEDKEKIAQLSTYLKKFEKAKDWDDYDLIIEGIRETIKGKQKPFVPDSSQGSGGGTHLSDSPEDKVTRALEKLKKKR